jgi:hypothetical protein
MVERAAEQGSLSRRQALARLSGGAAADLA